MTSTGDFSARTNEPAPFTLRGTDCLKWKSECLPSFMSAFEERVASWHREVPEVCAWGGLTQLSMQGVVFREYL